MSELNLDFLNDKSKTTYPNEMELLKRQTIGGIESLGLSVYSSGREGYRVVNSDETECMTVDNIFELEGLLFKLRRVFLQHTRRRS